MKVMKKKSKWRPFAEARKFARSLKLSSQKEWYRYCRGKLKDYPPKPKDIPASPKNVYKDKGWQGTADWLGNGSIPYQRKGHLPFAEARKFARSLKLSSQKEWLRYCRGELEAYPPKPKDIPVSPQDVYKGKGWTGTRDWLMKKKSKWRSFAEARSFARSLKLNSQEEWYWYCTGKLKDYPPKPKDIPASPKNVYKGKGWTGTRDWLMKKKSKWRSFAEARSFARSLKLNSQEEWYWYCTGKLKDYPPKPKDIPASPKNVYKGKGWTGTRDWLMKKKSKWRSFAEARSFARSLKLNSQEEWYWYCTGKLKAYPPKPKDIPASPQDVYKGKGWQGMSDWLGNARSRHANERQGA